MLVSLGHNTCVVVTYEAVAALILTDASDTSFALTKEIDLMGLIALDLVFRFFRSGSPATFREEVETMGLLTLDPVFLFGCSGSLAAFGEGAGRL